MSAGNPFYSVLERLTKPPESEPEDYRDNEGFLVCGKCGTRREMDIQLFPDKPLSRVPVMCQCRSEQYKREQERQKEQQRRMAMDEARETLIEIGAADIPEATFSQNDNRSQKNTETLKRYVDKFETIREQNIGLMLYGETGNGKTFFAECIANALWDQGYFVWMTSIRSISGAMSGNFGENRAILLRRIAQVDLLILDDFGAERDTSFMNEQVYDIINERYKAAAPLIITTNLNPKAMTEAATLTERRIYERVLEMCTPVQIEGKTRRKANAANKIATLKTILETE